MTTLNTEDECGCLQPECPYRVGAPSPHPRVDAFMSDADLTAAAEKIRASVDWARLPKLAEIFQHRPAVNRYWHELVALTLTSLEINGDAMRKRSAARGVDRDDG